LAFVRPDAIRSTEGEGAHAEDEHVLVDSLPRRAALLAGLIAEA